MASLLSAFTQWVIAAQNQLIFSSCVKALKGMQFKADLKLSIFPVLPHSTNLVK